MIDERDMYYGYGGYIPMNNMGMTNPMSNVGMTNPMSNVGMTNPSGQMQQMMPNNYGTSQFNDMNERISRLERQVKRLDQRLTRLETPYANNMKYNNEPDNNMYMM